MIHDLPLLKTVAVGFAAAWVLGIATHRMGLSPIVGYLLAGVLIGPHTPGFVGDPASAQQLAEIGVILMMFGVGLHFHLKDLVAVRGIAIPGAIGQSLLATLAGTLVCLAFGWTLSAGVVLGVAMSVASTVVLIRVLTDAGKMESAAGHAAVGWLIVEDIITVIALVLIPALAGGAAVVHAVDGATLSTAAGQAGHAATHAIETITAIPTAVADPPHTPHAPGASSQHWLISLGIALAKLAAMSVVVVGGAKVVPRLLVWVAKLRSRELFTLSVLVLSIAVAVGSAYLFGASVALGAFLAGMVVAQSPVSQQAGADVLPLRDAFAVLFFVSVGMLFDPMFVVREPALVAAGLAIVLVVKPLAAIGIVAVLGYPPRTALTVAIGLAQIGEFSFIVGDLAFSLDLLPEAGRNLLVASAIVSITINPLLFRSLDGLERALRKQPHLWKLLDHRSAARARELNKDLSPAGDDAADQLPDEQPADQLAAGPNPKPTPNLAIVVGYGPAGREVERLLRESGMRTRVLDLNVSTIKEVRSNGGEAVYGDATQSAILEQAGVGKASHLILTMPDAARRVEILAAASALNPAIRILVRARYASDRAALEHFHSVSVAVDEIEAAGEMARLVLESLGADRDQIRHEVNRVKAAFQTPAAQPPETPDDSAGGQPTETARPAAQPPETPDDSKG